MSALHSEAASSQSPWLGASTRHYENFPVGSWLVPTRLRPAIAAIYRFARYADDVADEGLAAPAQRLAELERLRLALEPGAGVSHPVVDTLLPYLTAFGLDRRHFLDLLSAFSQDVVITRYRTRAEVLDYCSRSANPVGRVMLELFERAEPVNLIWSDSICTALQLINFAQDVAIDWAKDRVYLPLEDLAAAGLDDAAIGAAVTAGGVTEPLRRVIADFCDDSRRRLDAGRQLPSRMPVRFGLELRVVLAGGARILDRLQACGFDPIAHRPVLTARDALALIRLALLNRPGPRASGAHARINSGTP